MHKLGWPSWHDHMNTRLEISSHGAACEQMDEGLTKRNSSHKMAIFLQVYYWWILINLQEALIPNSIKPVECLLASQFSHDRTSFLSNEKKYILYISYIWCKSTVLLEFSKTPVFQSFPVNCNLRVLCFCHFDELKFFDLCLNWCTN